MKTYSRIFLVSVITFLPAGSIVFGQGSLTPSAAPAPMMKTLDELQPRIPITSLPIIIQQPGNYYFTQTFAQNFLANAISIQTNNVTLDLYGFSLQQTATNAIFGILVSSSTSLPVTNVVIKNGFIGGFNSVGVNCFGTRSCTFENLTISDCTAGALSLQSLGSAPAAGNVVRRCHFFDNTGSGVVLSSGSGNVQNVYENCDAVNNTSAGFSLAAAGNFIMNCRASGNANNYVIAAGNRGGIVVLPAVNGTTINGSTGGGTGATD